MSSSYRTYFDARAARVTMLAKQCDAMIGLPDSDAFMGPKVIFSKPLFNLGYAIGTVRDGAAEHRRPARRHHRRHRAFARRGHEGPRRRPRRRSVPLSARRPAISTRRSMMVAS